jgi:hypothetical protein
MQVSVRLPDLAILIEGDALPERLRGVAAQLWQDGAADLVGGNVDETTGAKTIDMDLVRGLAQLRRHLAAMCLVDPAMSADDLLSGDIPAEDIDLLASIAMRERDTDALGVKLGVTPLSRFESFREEHGCPEDCESCAALTGRFSTRRVGVV